MGQVAAFGSCAAVTVHPDTVEHTRRQVPDHAEATVLAQLFRLLGDPRRTRILYALLEAGELCVCDISAAVGIPEAAVSQSLRLLRTAGVVANRRAGRMIYYRLADAHVRSLLDLSRERAGHRTDAAAD